MLLYDPILNLECFTNNLECCLQTHRVKRNVLILSLSLSNTLVPTIDPQNRNSALITKLPFCSP